MRISWRLALPLTALVAVLVTACGDGPETVVSVTPTPTSQPWAEEQATPTSQPQETDDYDSTAIMYAIIPDAIYSDGLDALNGALAKISAHGDVSQVSVLVETLGYFAGPAKRSIVEVLRELTGLDNGTSESAWKEWLGNNLADYDPPEGYADWKAAVLALTDDRFADFLDDPDKTARIDLREVVYGGVSPDGIPDLRNPKTVPAEEADFLSGEERVFGVSINGEHRAYPLRIVNPHEMVNDSLGGEPFALLW